MRRDDRDEPFDDLFREIERMMNEMMNGADANVDFNSSNTVDNGFGMDTPSTSTRPTRGPRRRGSPRRRKDNIELGSATARR